LKKSPGTALHDVESCRSKTGTNEEQSFLIELDDLIIGKMEHLSTVLPVKR
jgi:hypothetical protein